MFAAFLDRLLPILVIRNTALSKTIETFRHVFIVSVIDYGIVLVSADDVVEEWDDSAANSVVVDEVNGSTADIEDFATPSYYTTSDDVVSACAIASFKRIVIAFLNSTSPNFKS